MSSILSKKDHWREVYRQKRLNNGYLWLEELEKTSDPAALTAANYDKILQAIEQTLKHKDSFDVGCDLLREVFPIAFGMVDWGRWLTYLKGALATSQEMSSRSNNAYLHEWIADLELSLTNFSEAEPHFRKALELYLEEGETARYGRILPRLARVYAAKGQLSEAIDLCQDALRLGQKNDIPIVIAGAYFGLAEFNLRLSNYEDALAQCELATTYYEEIGNENFVFRTRVLAVVCKVHLKRYDEANNEAEYLMELFNDSENPYDNLIASIYLRNTIGIMAFQQEDYHTAEKHWHEAYQQSSMIGVPDTVASLGNNLGMVYTILEEFEAAEAVLLEALKMLDQLGDVPRWANCMDNLVDLYEKMGDWAAAKSTLETAIGRLQPEATMAHSQKMLREMQHRLDNLPDN